MSVKKSNYKCYTSTCTTLENPHDNIDYFHETNPEKTFAFTVQCSKKDQIDVKKLFAGSSEKAAIALRVLKIINPEV